MTQLNSATEGIVIASILTVPSEFGTAYYALFYSLAFILGTLWVFFEGYRRRWPMVPWLIVVGFCMVFAIIGSKLLTFSVQDITSILHYGRMPAATGRTFLGVLLGGVFGIAVARRWLGFPYSVLNAFAVAVPVAGAVSRLGCLLGGCCFGIPSQLPWAISYASSSVPFQFQVSTGLLTPVAAVSLPVHPTQIYEIVFSLAFLIVLLPLARRLRAPGNLGYVYAGGYAAFRFFKEFVRAGGEQFWGFKPAQWLVLASALVLIILVVHRERRWRRDPLDAVLPYRRPLREMGAIVVLLLLIWLGRNWFTPLELSLLQLLTLPAVLGFGFWWLGRITRFQLRWGNAKWALVIFMLVGWSYSEPPADSTRTVTDMLSIGGMFGQYEEFVLCGPPPVHTYAVGGVGWSRTHRYGEFRSFTYGARGYLGDDDPSGLIIAINPYSRYDWRWIGIGVGGHLGRLIFDGDALEPPLYPAAYLRLGPYDKFFLEGRLADHSPGSWPAPVIQLGLGFGIPNRGNLRLGVSDAGYYFSGRLPAPGQGLVFSPFFAVGTENIFQFGGTVHLPLDRK